MPTKQIHHSLRQNVLKEILKILKASYEEDFIFICCGVTVFSIEHATVGCIFKLIYIILHGSISYVTNATVKNKQTKKTLNVYLNVFSKMHNSQIT